MPRGIKKIVRRNVGFKINRKLYDTLVGTSAQLVRAYAEGLKNGGSVDWSSVDRAHEMALRSQRMLLRHRRGMGVRRKKKNGAAK
jgi:hypothetical protein